MPAIAQIARAATRAAESELIAKTRALLGPGASENLVRDALRMDLDHLVHGAVVDGTIQGLHVAPGPGRAGIFDVTRVSNSGARVTEAPTAGRTWRAQLSADGLAPKHSVMFPPDWTVSDVVDGARHVQSSAIGLPRPRNGNDTFLLDGRWRGIDMRVIWDRASDRIVTAYPRRANQAATR